MWVGRAAVRLSLALATATLTACSSMPKAPKLPVSPGVPQAALPSVPSRVDGLQVRTAPDMNQRMALMLDVVFVHDAKVVAKLPTEAPVWFLQREQLHLKYAGFVDVLSFELTVSDDTGWLSLTKQQRSAERVLVYANYLAVEGQQMANISVFRCPRLMAMSGGLVISEGPFEWVMDRPFGRPVVGRHGWGGDDDIRCGR